MSNSQSPYDSLHRALHEPKRLAIVSALASTDKGLTFNELREVGELTDGNLNRHLKMLEEEKIIKLKKVLAGGRARTVVTLSATGKKRFLEYLNALEVVLKDAAKAVKAGEKAAAKGLRTKTA